MKLLLDENLSRRLVPFLQYEFPGSTQVALVGLEQADDRTIWHRALLHETLLEKDIACIELGPQEVDQ
ncbi:MAG: DUF5615 family PIN-like protein [Sulfuritalea sp.]|nr:DUF5615 family PIN-like protein [Sulfuritalea sp.]